MSSPLAIWAYTCSSTLSLLCSCCTRIRLIVPEEVVMQPRFTVGILLMKAEGLVSTIRYSGFLFQMAPISVVAEPQQITVLIGHLPRDTNLVAVEVVGLLAGFVSDGVAFYGNAAEVVAFAVLRHRCGRRVRGFHRNRTLPSVPMRRQRRYGLCGSRTSILRRGCCYF